MGLKQHLHKQHENSGNTVPEEMEELVRSHDKKFCIYLCMQLQEHKTAAAKLIGHI